MYPQTYTQFSISLTVGFSNCLYQIKHSNIFPKSPMFMKTNTIHKEALLDIYACVLKSISMCWPYINDSSYILLYCLQVPYNNCL